MDRCALFVDAGYLLADGAMAVHGTRHREAVSWDFGGLLQLLGNLARERTGMPLLRCYWYEATVEGRRGTEHEALADLPGLKLRLGRVRPGRREGVDTEIHRDLMTLARNSAVADAIVVSGDEDLVQIISDAQDLGVRVTVVHVAVDGNWTISRSLRQECDDLIEIGSSHLRPYVNLLAGLDTGSSSPLSNGHGNGQANGHGNGSTGSNGVIAPLRTAPHAGPPASSPLTPAPLSAPSLAGSGLSQSSPQPSSLSGFPSRLGQTQPQSHGQSHSHSHTQGQSTSPAQVPAQRSLSSTGTSSTGMSGAGVLGPTTGSSALSGYLPGSPSGLSTGGSPLPGQAGHLQATRSPMQPSGGGGISGTGMGSTGMRLPSDGGGLTGGAQYSVSPASVPQQSSNPYGMGGGGGQLAPVPQQQQPQQQGSPSLSDAVKAAHQEGQDFGESVARDAPALWLEAVLARKPRMPSDLEARLLQGSSLPIDYLLHDEVRHALRRGFWDALERSRR